MSVILIGMPSCGKSTIGVLLAKQLGLRFIDSDLVIQEKEGRLLHDIIEQEGNARFLEIESKVNCALQDRGAVISTGGSAVYSDEAMRHLETLGTIVYIHISYAEMVSRLGDYVHRGVVVPEGYTLSALYRERATLYEKYAHITVDGERGIPETIAAILANLQQKNKEEGKI